MKGYAPPPTPFHLHHPTFVHHPVKPLLDARCQRPNNTTHIEKRRCRHVVAPQQRDDGDVGGARRGEVAEAAGLVDEVDAQELVAEGDGGAELREGGVEVVFLGAPIVVGEPGRETLG